MVWVRATLRGKEVLAHALSTGELDVREGRVEIRYRPTDGRLYRAAASNIIVADPTPLPEEHCGPAKAVEDVKRKKEGRRPEPVREQVGEEGTQTGLVSGGLVAWTDGACTGNPGPAGLGIVLEEGDERTEIAEYLGQGTNNIAELTAILRVLEMVPRERSLVVHTDSQYSIGVLQKGWKAKANRELILAIKGKLAEREAVRLKYTPGHAGVELNERADKLARMAIANRGNFRTTTRVRTTRAGAG